MCVCVCVCVCVIWLTDSPLLCPESDSADSSVMSLITVCVSVCTVGLCLSVQCILVCMSLSVHVSLCSSGMRAYVCVLLCSCVG